MLGCAHCKMSTQAPPVSTEGVFLLQKSGKVYKKESLATGDGAREERLRRSAVLDSGELHPVVTMAFWPSWLAANAREIELSPVLTDLVVRRRRH